jgi:hypothetical protein
MQISGRIEATTVVILNKSALTKNPTESKFSTRFYGIHGDEFHVKKKHQF